MTTTTPSKTVVQLAAVREWVRTGRCRQIREHANVSQGEVARAVGVEPATVCRWEAGQRMPQGDAAIRYLEVLEALAKAQS